MPAFRLHLWERRQLVDPIGPFPITPSNSGVTKLGCGSTTGSPVLRVAEMLRVEPRTVYNRTYAFRQRTDLTPLTRLRAAPRSGRPPAALGILDPLLDAVIDDPRDYAPAVPGQPRLPA
jgi:hypothetical protein